MVVTLKINSMFGFSKSVPKMMSLTEKFNRCGVLRKSQLEYSHSTKRRSVISISISKKEQQLSIQKRYLRNSLKWYIPEKVLKWICLALGGIGSFKCLVRICSFSDLSKCWHIAFGIEMKRENVLLKIFLIWW